MQNKKRGFLRFVKEKGYYIVLGLCVIAVGASGYLFIKTQTKKPTENLSIPNTAASASGRASSEADTRLQTKQSDLPVLKPEDEAPQQTTRQQPTQSLKTAMPVDGQLLLGYATDRLVFNVTTQDWRTHRGLDLSAAAGASVAAAADGTVYAVLDDEALGKTVVLRHADGYTTHYSNLSDEVLVAVGQEVTCGTALGTVGQTALVEVGSEPHLHFEVYRNNVPQDPAEFLKMQQTAEAND